MQLLDFIEKNNLTSNDEKSRCKHLAFWYCKINKEFVFNKNLIEKLFQDAGFSKPNFSRLKDKLIKGKDKIFIETKQGLEFIPATLQFLEREVGNNFKDNETIVSGSELLDEGKFITKNSTLNKLIKQVNNNYKNNCWDACAVLLRRVFEISLILTYQHNNIESEIIDSQGRYLLLDKIIVDAKNNTTLKLSGKNANQYDKYKLFGNLSAHELTYNASKQDIDSMFPQYRVMLEELYKKAGLI